MALAFTPFSFGAVKPSIIARLKAGEPLSILSSGASPAPVQVRPAPVASSPTPTSRTSPAAIAAVGAPPARPFIQVTPPRPVQLMPMLPAGLVPTPQAPAPVHPTVRIPAASSGTVYTPTAVAPAVERDRGDPCGGGCGTEAPIGGSSSTAIVPATPRLTPGLAPTLSTALALEAGRSPAPRSDAITGPISDGPGIPPRPFLEPVELALVIVSLLIILAALVASRTKGVGVASAFGKFIPEPA